MQNKIFEGLKVVELASVLAGPAVGMFFAELGAEVIKIENQPTGGDVTRNWKLPNEDKNSSISAYYCCVNWGKKAFLLNLNDENDRKKVYSYIIDADIVISNFKKSSAQKMGMDYDSLQKMNPTLIFAQLTSYGEDDETPAFDVVLQAEAGFLHMTGENPSREPVKMPVALIDLLAAHQLKEGILVALLQRYKTGKGAYITASLLDSALASLANQATNWLMAGQIPQRMGSMHPNIAPYGDIFKTKDGKQIVLAVGTEKQFQLLCTVISAPVLIDDNLLKTNYLRVQNRLYMNKILAKYIKKFECDKLLISLKKAGVPVGEIKDMKSVFDMPKAQAMILEERLDDGRISKRVKTVVFEILD